MNYLTTKSFVKICNLFPVKCKDNKDKIYEILLNNAGYSTSKFPNKSQFGIIYNDLVSLRKMIGDDHKDIDNPTYISLTRELHNKICEHGTDFLKFFVALSGHGYSCPDVTPSYRIQLDSVSFKSIQDNSTVKSPSIGGKVTAKKTKKVAHKNKTKTKSKKISVKKASVKSKK
jgi:hypothetical protein